jgi:hypothetical protein
VAIVLAVTGYLERRGHKREDTLLRALEHLTGGSQKRSVGIALIEGLWHNGHPYHRAVLPALVNQAVYLLLETESSGRHQFHSWLRIMELILRVPSEPQLHEHFCELAEALNERATNGGKRERGLEITSATAKAWLKKVHEHAGLGAVI